MMRCGGRFNGVCRGGGEYMGICTIVEKVRSSIILLRSASNYRTFSSGERARGS